MRTMVRLDRALVLGMLALVGTVLGAGGRLGSGLAFVAGVAGLLALLERLRAEYSPAVATVSVLAIFAGSPVYWTMVHRTSPGEAIGFALTAVIVATLPRDHRGWRAAACWAVLALIPVAFALAGPSQAVVSGGAWLERLFGSPTGFFATSPLAHIGILGTLLGLRHGLFRPLGLVGVCVLWTLSSSAGEGRDIGLASHGLTPAIALLGTGVAAAIDGLRRRPLAGALVIAATAAVWNYWLMVQYGTGLLPKDAPVSFASMVRQQADVHTAPPYVYPLALPANVVFAWRHGVPADRFEALAFQEPQNRIDAEMGRAVVPWLLDGWEAPGGNARESAQWIREPAATVILPVDLARATDVDLTITARARLEEPPVRATVDVALNGLEVGRIVADPHAPGEFTIRIPAATIGRLGRSGYNRVTFHSVGFDRIDPDDPRPPGPIASRPAGRPWPVAIYRIRVTPS